MRTQFVNDVNGALEKQLMYTDYDRWYQIFGTQYAEAQEPLTLAGRDVEEVVEDLDEIDAYFANMEAKRSITGGEILAMSDSEGWV